MALAGVSDYSGGFAGHGPGAEEDLLAQWERSPGSPGGIRQQDFSSRERPFSDPDGLGSPSGLTVDRFVELGAPIGALGSSPSLDSLGTSASGALDPSGRLDRELTSLTGQLPGLSLDPADLSPWGQLGANSPLAQSDGEAVDWFTGLANPAGSESSGTLVSNNLSPLLAGAFAADPLLVHREVEPTSPAQAALGPAFAEASSFPLSGELQRLAGPTKELWLAAEQVVLDRLRSLAANPQAAALLLETFPGSGEPIDGVRGPTLESAAKAPRLEAIDAFLRQLGGDDGLQAAGLALPISVQGAAVMGAAAAAYALQAPDGQQRIYVNGDWLNRQSSSDAIAAVLLEELGHAIDQKLNLGQDSPGDEGQLFALMMADQVLSVPELAVIRAENDDAILTISGMGIQVEESSSQYAPVIGGIDAVIDYISSDFLASPANATIGGSAFLSSGECVLTPAVSYQNGYIVYNELASSPTAFTAQFDYRVADGNGADGTSFNYGVMSVPPTGYYENGVTSGLVVSLIEWGTDRMVIKYNGVQLSVVNLTLIGPSYRQFVVKIDALSRLSVSVSGQTIVSDISLGAAYASADKSAWKFGFASRNGGANNKHSIDNFRVSSNNEAVSAAEQIKTLIAASLTLADQDSATLQAASVTITNGLQAAEDRLEFSANSDLYANIAGSYDSATGRLALTSADSMASLAQWQAALRSITYTNTSDVPGSGTRTISFLVNDGVNASSPALISLVSTAVNDAPIAASSALASINEDIADASNLGTQVSALAANNLDPDASALKGIAITAADTTNGVWSYTTNGGTNWLPLAGISADAALLLKGNDSSHKIRFSPNQNYTGSASITYRAWDQTSGLAGSTTSVSTAGGSTAFSANSVAAIIDVTPVNDAPVATGFATLLPVNEDTTAPAGDTVTNLFVARFSDLIDSMGGGLSANSLLGVVLTNNASTSAQGSWQWSNAGSWTNISTSLADDRGLFLTADTSVRFLPGANFNGTPGSLTTRLADNSISAPINGSTINVSGANNGGSSAYSSTTVSLGSSINPVNDAPVLLNLNLKATEDTPFAFDAALFASVSPAIRYVGSQVDMGTAWRSSSTAKPYDIDSNNILGSDGWWLTGSALKSPTYITSFSNNSYYYTNGGYAQIDNPLTTPGPNPSTIYTGTTNQQFPGYLNLSASPVISFTLTGTIPDAIRLGIMTGNTDVGGSFGSSGFKIVSGTLDSGLSTELETNNASYNGNPDWVFFDIKGGTSGQVYSIYARGGPRGNAAIGGISFDSAASKSYSDVENTPMDSIAIVSLPTSGVLRVSGVDAFAGQVVDAANLGSMAYIPAANETGIKTFTISASDGALSSATATVSITIAAVNDPPITTAGNTLFYLENGAAAPIDTTISLVDVDNASFTGATVTISAGLTSGDALGFTAQNGILGSYNASTGVLTLTGSATVAQFQAALRSVSYSSTSDNPTATSSNRTISWQVNDGSALSAPVSSTIAITALNDAPVITSGSTYSFTTTNEDTTSLAIAASTLLTAASWVDVDVSSLSGLAITATTGNGAWQYSTDGTTWQAFGSMSSTNALLLASASQVRYLPDGNNGETATFAYKAWDQTTGFASTGATANYATTASSGGTTAFSINTSSAQIIVSSINDAPILDGTRSPFLNAINEDTPAPSSASIANSTPVSALVVGISDVDPSASSGIAITAVNSANGILYYSTNGGSTWNPVGTVSSTAALLLASDSNTCLLYTSPSPRDRTRSRMPSSA